MAINAHFYTQIQSGRQKWIQRQGVKVPIQIRKDKDTSLSWRGQRTDLKLSSFSILATVIWRCMLATLQPKIPIWIWGNTLVELLITVVATQGANSSIWKGWVEFQQWGMKTERVRKAFHTGGCVLVCIHRAPSPARCQCWWELLDTTE